MKICPYCNKPAENDWSYCRHCNKPLIVNLRSNYNKSYSQISCDKSFNDEAQQSQEYSDSNETKLDEEIDHKIRQINAVLEQRQAIGESTSKLQLEKASLYYQKRDLTESLKIMEMALNAFKEENDLLNMGIVYNEMGLIKEDTGFFDDAIYQFERAIDIFQNIPDFNKLIQVYNNLANVYFLVKDIENSNDIYQKALSLARRENLILEEVKTSSNLIEILFLLKDYNQIASILEKNLEFFKQNNDIYGTIITMTKYGKLYFNLGENYFDQSFQSLNSALELINNIKNQVKVFIKAQLEWELYLYLGNLYLLWNNSIEAEGFFLKSLEAIRTFEIGENINEGNILEKLGNLYAAKSEYEKSIEYFKLSVEIFYKFGDDIKSAELKFKMANIYSLFLHDESNAIQLFEDALEIFEELNYDKQSAEILHKLGDIYIQKGETDQAISNFEKAKEYYSELQDEYNVNLLTEKINSLTNTNSDDN